MSDNYTPKNEWELQYEREYNRILQAIRRQEKLGYYVPKSVKPIAPSKVKNITQTDVEYLIQLTPKEIRKQSVYIDKYTGQQYQGLDVVVSHHKAKPSVANITQQHHKPKQISTPTVRTPRKTHKNEPSDFTEPTKSEFTAPPKENNLNMQIIDDITRILNQWQPEIYWTPSFHQRKLQTYYTLTQVWAEILENDGEYETAYRIESNAQEIKDLIQRLIYDSDSQLEDEINLARLLTLLFGRAISAFEADYYTETAQSMVQDTLMGENSIG